MARIYVSSTFADLKEHREAIYRALRRLQHEVVAMEDYVAADDRPVDKCLPDVASCDIYVGIFAWRYGHVPTRNNPNKLSITELEYRKARALKKPCLIHVLDEKAPWVRTNDDAATGENQRGKRIKALRQELDRERVSARFTSVHELAELVGAAVTNCLEKQKKQKKRTTPSKTPQKPGPPTIPQTYRDWLAKKCEGIDLLGLQLKHGQAVQLSHVYVPLTTTAPGGQKEGRDGAERAMREDLITLLLHRLGESSLYVPGDPGSGKSTFCRWVAWIVCQGSVPGLDIEADKQFVERLPSTLSNKLPVLVRLREFWEALPESTTSGGLSGKQLRDKLAAWLDTKDQGGLSGTTLCSHLSHGQGLLILDGVDEVPPSRRAVLVAALSDAVATWTKAGNRVLITSRPYGLSDGEVAALGLPQAQIQPLNPVLQRMLVRRWFAILSQQGETTASSTADEMLKQVSDQPWLGPLRANPLLLTGMCIVYGDGKRLPQDKFDLFDRLVDAVLYNRIDDKHHIGLVRDRLAVIAHGMQTGDGLGDQRSAPQALVTDDEIDRMLRSYQERQTWSETTKREVFLDREELLSRTGLLIPQGEHRAAFYHLSFQDFFAAQRMADLDADRLLHVMVERGEAPEWRNTLSFLYGKLLAASTSPERPVRLLSDVVAGLVADAWGTQVVATDCVDILRGRGCRLAAEAEAKLSGLCRVSMRAAPVARERCALGDALVRLGDSRFRADAWFLPADEMLGFIEIPAGPFTMGSDKKKDPAAWDDELPVHSVTLPTFYMARFPVTVGQFRAFAEENAANGGFTPGDPDCLRGVVTHPVVSVSWHDALAYCDWLTTKLAAWAETPEALARVLRPPTKVDKGWRVTLASEAEWEKAARGETDSRIFPWGDEADPNKANYNDTGIGGTSAVGCFPGGASPYGVGELSGNAWEWTRSLRGKYPYRPGPKREDLTAGKDKDRAVRGGAFLDSDGDVRAVARGRGRPGIRGRNVGFRVVVSPFFSDL